MQRATPWFVGPAIHGARAAQLLSRSRAHFRERARRAHTGAQQIDAQRPRLVAHSLSRLECRLPLMAKHGKASCLALSSAELPVRRAIEGDQAGLSRAKAVRTDRNAALNDRHRLGLPGRLDTGVGRSHHDEALPGLPAGVQMEAANHSDGGAGG